ncbi:hypothetical protein ACTHSI_27565, partial [Neisseria sp. P0001.S004]
MDILLNVSLARRFVYEKEVIPAQLVLMALLAQPVQLVLKDVSKHILRSRRPPGSVDLGGLRINKKLF